MKQFLQKNKKLLLLSGIALLFVIGPFAGVHVASAQAVCVPSGLEIVSGMCSIAASLLFIPFIFTSWLLSISGLLLNFVLKYTVENMSANISGISGIEIAWQTIRDLMNMSFIFILLYTAIGTILDIGGINWKKNILNIIIAAVLINFSLFFTKILIDASNIFTLTFYRIIVPAGSAGGLSDTFMRPLGLTTIFSFDAGSTLLSEFNYQMSKVLVVALGGGAFFIVTAFVFMAVAIMFLIRYITIVFLLILSPVAFMGNLVPKLSASVGEWWKTLWNQVIFAPVFMILTWVVVTIINSTGFLCAQDPGSGTGSIRDALSGLFGNNLAVGGGAPVVCLGDSSIGLLMNFIIVIAFIIAALTISQKIASQGGSAGQKLVMGGLGLAGTAIGATGGYAGRRTIGSLAQGVSDNQNLKDRAAKGEIGARLALSAATRTANSSFDARNATSKLDKYAGSLGIKDTGLGAFGKASGKGGYNAYLKDQVKKTEEKAKSFAPSAFATDQAKKELEATKKIVPDAEKDLASHNAQIVSIQSQIDSETDPIKKTQLEEGLKNLQSDKVTKENNLEKLREIALEKERASQTKLDNMSGVSEDDAKKLLQKQLKMSDEKFKEYLKDNKEEAQRGIDAFKVESAGDRNKKAYTDGLENPKAISSNRVWYVGKVKKSNKIAAANIRKGDKKSVTDRLKDILKEEGEIKTPEATPAPAPSATPTTPKP